MKYALFMFAILLIACGPKQKKDVTSNNIDASTAEYRPNIIVILVDDAGYVDFGFMGSEDLQTPEIDKIANSGTIFTDAHVSATVCAPSRAGLITGKYQQRFGFEANGTGAVGLSAGVTTMADVFQSNGYNTYALGKWHLGSDPSDQPNQRGFDDFYGFLSGSRSYFPLENPSENDMLQHNGERVKFDGYMTDVLGDQSVKFAEQSGDQPFFMYLAYNAVHTPMDAKEEDLEKFKDHPRQKLAAMTWSLDENVGKLRAKLKELGKLENTLIYFLSDNGGAHNNQSKTGPLKGWKGNKFEGGHRVSFAISWPSRFQGGEKFAGLTSSLDIFPTSLSAAGIQKPDDLVLDGANLLPYLRGEKSGDPHESLFWRKLDKSAARIGDYKTITLDGYGSVMYDLSNDLGETNNLTEIESVKFDSIQIAYNTWQAHLMQPLWDEGETWMGICSHIHRQLMQNEEPDYKDPWSNAYKNRSDGKTK
ncbi:MAG: sulfatase-like hydrolase/transferase [Pricia sp.]